MSYIIVYPFFSFFYSFLLIFYTIWVDTTYTIFKQCLYLPIFKSICAFQYFYFFFQLICTIITFIVGFVKIYTSNFISIFSYFIIVFSYFFVLFLFRFCQFFIFFLTNLSRVVSKQN